jgi:hypothetical protein
MKAFYCKKLYGARAASAYDVRGDEKTLLLTEGEAITATRCARARATLFCLRFCLISACSRSRIVSCTKCENAKVHDGMGKACTDYKIEDHLPAA